MKIDLPYEECAFCIHREGINCLRGIFVCPVEVEDEDELE